MDKYSYIKAEEGFKPKAYKDTRGVETIGHGQRVDEIVVDESTAGKWLLARMDAIEAFLSHFQWWNPLPEPAQAALISMVYQLGEAGFSEFRNFIRLLAERNYGAAADEMLRSEWAKQTPNRAHRAALMIRNGEWPVF